MRTSNERARLQMAKTKSRRSEQQTILETSRQREYFRFQEGCLVEYDLTKCNNRQIKLSDEERFGLILFSNPEE